MKIIYVTLLLVGFSYSGFSQSTSFGLYQYNIKTINPSLMALSNEQNFDCQYRTSVKYPEIIPSILLSYSTKVNKINSGIGLIFSSEYLGVYLNSNASLLYNYQLKLNSKSKISIGTQLHYKKITAHYYNSFSNPADPPYASSKDNQPGNLALDIGVLYQINKLNFSIGAQNLSHTNKGTGYKYDRELIYNFYAFEEFPLTRWLAITPSILTKTDLDSWYMDLNSTFLIKKMVLLGFTERITQTNIYGIYSAGVSIKDKFQLIALVYSGDRPFYNSNTIEMMARVKISND